MSDTIKNIEEKNGVVVISTYGYFNNIAGDAVLEVFNQKMESGNTKSVSYTHLTLPTIE